MGRPKKSEYIKSTRRLSNTLENEKQGDHNTYRRIMHVRQVWFEQSNFWHKLGCPPQVDALMPDGELISYTISRRSDGEYLVECGEFTWID